MGPPRRGREGQSPQGRAGECGACVLCLRMETCPCLHDRTLPWCLDPGWRGPLFVSNNALAMRSHASGPTDHQLWESLGQPPHAHYPKQVTHRSNCFPCGTWGRQFPHHHAPPRTTIQHPHQRPHRRGDFYKRCTSTFRCVLPPPLLASNVFQGGNPCPGVMLNHEERKTCSLCNRSSILQGGGREQRNTSKKPGIRRYFFFKKPGIRR